MKKLFLTSGLVLCMACPAMAATDIAVTDQNTTSATCTNTYLDSYTGPVSFEAKWTADSYDVNYAPGVAQNTTNGVSGHTHIPQGSMANGSVTYDDGLTPAANGFTTPTGYRFTGWNGAKLDGTSGTQDYAAGTTYTPYKIAGPITLTAQWEPEEYTIQYKNGSFTAANGTVRTPTQTMNNETVKYDEDKTLTANAYSIPGYNFTGWVGNYSNATEGGTLADTPYSNGASLSPYHIAHTLELTAQWSPETYTITYAPGQAGNRATTPDNYVTGTTASSSATYDATNIELRANGYSAEGYHFVGWKADSVDITTGESAANGTIYGTGDLSNSNWTVAALSTYKVDGPTTLTAQWAPNHYNVTFNSGAHGTISGNATYSDNYNSSTGNGGAEFDAAYTIPGGAAVTAATGYTFAGWNTAENQTVGNFESGDTWTFAANTTLHAAYTANPTKLQYDCWHSNSVPPVTPTWSGAEQVNLNYDDTYAHPDGATYCGDLASHGYAFRGWNCVGSNEGMPSATVDTTNAIANAGIANGKWAADFRDVKCTALWEANTINLTWYDDTAANNGEVITLGQEDAGAANCTYDGGITLPAQPSKTGYSFDGWKVRQTVQAAPVEQGGIQNP